MASNDTGTSLSDDVATAVVPTSLRQRASAIQVIGTPNVDRAAQRQQRLGFSLLLALALGWNSLMVAANSTAPFHTAIGRFLLIFAVTVGSIRALGNLYDRYLDEAEAEYRKTQQAQRLIDAASTHVNTDQPAPGTE